MSSVSTIVVAGGRSRRFDDREKALEPVDGAPMLVRVARAVAPVPGDLVVNCRRDQHDAFRTALETADLPCSVRFAFDRTPDGGPLDGLKTGLDVATGETAVVVAADLSLLERGVIDGLLDAHAAATGEATVPHLDGRPQPLCAVYEVRSTRAAAADALADDRRRLRDLLTAMDVTTVDRETVAQWTDPARLRSVDDPDDLQWARQYVRRADTEDGTDPADAPEQ